MALFKALVFSLSAASAQTPPTEIGPFASMGQCTEAARVILTPQAHEISSADGVVSGVLAVEIPKNNLLNGSMTYVIKRSIHCYEVSPGSH
jgi:hypothetical protein